MNTSNYVSNTVTAASLTPGSLGQSGGMQYSYDANAHLNQIIQQSMQRQREVPPNIFFDEPAEIPDETDEKESEMATPTSKRRIVKVFIVDTDDNVPLDQCTVFAGDEKLTELEDNELFFEININDILKKYNEKRVSFINKKVKDRVEQLEPVRVKDLKMTVVTVAAF